jgi:hypothetical protein
VVITLDDNKAMLRPDLSATAEIVADTRVGVVAVPIIALIMRPTQCRPGRRGGRRAAPAASGDPEALNVGCSWWAAAP